MNGADELILEDVVDDIIRMEQVTLSPDVCTHPTNFNSYASVAVHHADTDQSIIGFTIVFRLECADCKQRFHFGRSPRFHDGRMEVEISCAPGRAPLEAPWVPGTFECSQCMFRLQSNIISAHSGNIAPDRKREPEPCPNECGGVMKRVTWQQAANDMGNMAEQLVRRVRQLEEAWPAGYIMPLPEEDV